MAKKSHLKDVDYSKQPRITNDEGREASREIAYKYIYRNNRDKYPLRFSEYVVHHIDGDVFNNSVKNLHICTKEDHNFIHFKIKELGKYPNSDEIYSLLQTKKTEEDKYLKSLADFRIEERKTEEFSTPTDAGDGWSYVFTCPTCLGHSFVCLTGERGNAKLCMKCFDLVMDELVFSDEDYEIIKKKV